VTCPSAGSVVGVVRAGGVQPAIVSTVTRRNATPGRSLERRRLSAGGTIGQRRIGRTGDGDTSVSGHTFRMRSAGFLSERQRRFAWVGFLLAAFQAPAAAKLVDDASWLFAVIVAMVVATVIIADDAARRRPEPVE
jgi:hypothetical protein